MNSLNGTCASDWIRKPHGLVHSSLPHARTTPALAANAFSFLCLLACVCSAAPATATAASDRTDSEYLRAFKKFIESPPIIKSLKARVETRGVSFTFIENDITNITSFADKLRHPPPSDTLSLYLHTNLSPQVQELLTNRSASSNLQAQLRQVLVPELNRIIQTRPIYDSERFLNVRLSAGTSALLKKPVAGPELVRLNRLLLLDAYPNELSNRNHPDKKEVFIETRYQSNACFVKTAPTLTELAASYVRPITRIEEIAGTPVTHSMAAGWHGTNLWSIARGIFQTDTLSEELCSAYSVSNRNPVILQLPMLLPARIMSMGLPAEKPGSLRWSGSSAYGTDHFGSPFTAELQRDPQGRPSGAKITYSQQNATGPLHPREATLDYEYDRQIPGWSLPTKIRIGQTNWTAEILSVEFSTEPLEPRWFHYNPFLNHHSRLGLLIARRCEKELYRVAYNDLQHGMRQVAGLWLTKQQLRSCAYLLFFALTASLIAAAVSQDKRRQQQATTNKPNKMKTKQTSPLLKATLAIALVAVTYNLATACWIVYGGGTSQCRNVLSSGPSATVVISEQTCTLAEDSGFDDVVTPDDPTDVGPLSGYSRSYGSLCRVAYQCPPPAQPIELVAYSMSSSAWVLYHDATCQ